MALRDLLFDSERIATATVATPATPDTSKGETVAGVAVADARNSKTSEQVSRLIADPAGSCPDCGTGQWWQLPGEAWHCRACEPDMPLTATTLTLPCHKVKAWPARADARLRTLLEAACQGLTITPEQLRQELEAGGDLPDLQSGAS